MSSDDFTGKTMWGSHPVARKVADALSRERVVLTGTIVTAGCRQLGGHRCYTCTLDDSTGTIGLLFLGRDRVPGFRAGAVCTVEGTAQADGKQLVVWNPRYRFEPVPAGDAVTVVTPETVVTAEADAQDVEQARPVAAPDEPVEEQVEATGHFRIYLGAVAGVGKTVAMLEEAHRRLDRGADVVAALVECHGRAHTAGHLAGLEVVPRRRVLYRGATFEEMDLDAVLRRRPQVALVDELAHTNVPGSGRHPKRWEDVVELLDADIDVISTVNIQHLESLADAVEAITGQRVHERVPDWVVRRADQIELVDSSPEQLRRRMLHGNIYPPERVDQALTAFFRTDNLRALRELALRFLADETDEELLAQLARSNPAVVWETAERIMVGVTAAPGTDAIVRRASRMAARTKADLHVVHAHSGDRAPDERRLDELRQVVSDVGADWHELTADDPVEALIGFARDHQITQIVIGSSRRSRWQELTGGGAIVKRLTRQAAGAGLDVHIIARRGNSPLPDTTTR